MLRGDAARGRSVVWGTGEMVPCGMAVTVGTTGGIVVVGMGASVAARAVELRVGGAGATAAGGGGVTGGRDMAISSATVPSFDTESAGGGGRTWRGTAVSRGNDGTASLAGFDVRGRTTGDAEDVGGGDEGGGLMVAVSMAAGAGGLGTEAAASREGSTVGGVVGASAEVVSGTTVSDGGSGSAWTTAMTSSGLRPSKSAF